MMQNYKKNIKLQKYLLIFLSFYEIILIFVP